MLDDRGLLLCNCTSEGIILYDIGPIHIAHCGLRKILRLDALVQVAFEGHNVIYVVERLSIAWPNQVGTRTREKKGYTNQ